MRRWMVGLLVAALAACHGKSYYFTGNVYDGVTGQPITNYKIQVSYKTSVTDGSVDKTGFYNVGPIPPLADFTVTISATGYRAFYSVNSELPVADDSCDNQYDDCGTQDTTKSADAYLFPTSLQSPAATVSVLLSDSATLPSGTIRFVPTASGAFQDSTTDNVVDSGNDAVTSNDNAGGEVYAWSNTANLQLGIYTTTFTNGQVQVPAGALVYGTHYQLNVYGVDGYEVTVFNDYTAGRDGDYEVTLTPTTAQQPLALVYSSAESSVPTGVPVTLTLVFNEAIQLSPRFDENYFIEQISDNFDLHLHGSGGVAEQGVQADYVDGGPNIYGISVAVSSTNANELVITATLPDTSFSTPLASTDYISSVTFGESGLDSISVVEVANPNMEYELGTDGSTFSGGTDIGNDISSDQTVIVTAKTAD